jgi:hypothetical protein
MTVSAVAWTISGLAFVEGAADQDAEQGGLRPPDVTTRAASRT